MTPEKLALLLSRQEDVDLEFKLQYVLEGQGRDRNLDELAKDLVALVNSAASESYLVIGAGDELKQGARQARSVAGAGYSADQFVQILNSRVTPPVSRLEYEEITRQEAVYGVVTLHRSPFIHALSRDLVTPKRTWPKNSVLVRHGAGVDVANPLEILEMSRRFTDAQPQQEIEVVCEPRTNSRESACQRLSGVLQHLLRSRARDDFVIRYDTKRIWFYCGEQPRLEIEGDLFMGSLEASIAEGCVRLRKVGIFATYFGLRGQVNVEGFVDAMAKAYAKDSRKALEQWKYLTNATDILECAFTLREHAANMAAARFSAVEELPSGRNPSVAGWTYFEPAQSYVRPITQADLQQMTGMTPKYYCLARGVDLLNGEHSLRYVSMHPQPDCCILSDSVMVFRPCKIAHELCAQDEYPVWYDHGYMASFETGETLVTNASPAVPRLARRMHDTGDGWRIMAVPCLSGEANNPLLKGVKIKNIKWEYLPGNPNEVRLTTPRGTTILPFAVLLSTPSPYKAAELSSELNA